MKKLIFTVILLLWQTMAMAFCGNFYIDGYWGQWEDLSFTIDGSGSINNFVLMRSGHHPSDYFVHVTIDNYTPPTKEVKKYHSKNNLWYEYTGTVEYFVDEGNPTIESLLKSGWFGWALNSADDTYGHHVKRTARATIKIAPYKNKPKTLNIYFDNVGFGISF